MEQLVLTFKENFVYDLVWFVVSTLALVVLLPRYIEQRPIRRMIASRIARVHQTLRAYLTSLVPDPPTERSGDHTGELADLKNAIHHMMDVPNHFTIALWGDVGSSYFQYRMMATNVAATSALAAGDYDDFFRSIFFTNANIPSSSIAELNQSYELAQKDLGGDIHNVPAMQVLVAPWTSAEVECVAAAYATLRGNGDWSTPAK